MDSGTRGTVEGEGTLKARGWCEDCHTALWNCHGLLLPLPSENRGFLDKSWEDSSLRTENRNLQMLSASGFASELAQPDLPTVRPAA